MYLIVPRAARPLSIALLLAFPLTGCMSLSTMQTARTLPRGESQWTSGTGTYSYQMTDPENDSKEKLAGAYYEMSYRQGLGDRVDMGARFMFIGAAMVDVKYHLLQRDRFDAAIGGGIGYLRLTSDDEDGEDDSVDMLDVALPLYLSYEISPQFTPYLSPRLAWRNKAVETGREQLLPGATLGIKIGSKAGFYIEYGYQADLRSDFRAGQFNIAWYWRR